MKTILLFSFLLLFSQFTYAQAPIIEWQKTIGGSEAEVLYSMQQTADGGYILGGQSTSGISSDKTEANMGGWDYWIVKLDANGNIVWQNTIGGSGDDYIRSIQQTVDGGYVLGGRSISGVSGDKTEAGQGDWDWWVNKLDANGDIVWQNTIGGSGYDELFSIRQTNDGKYIIAGFNRFRMASKRVSNEKFFCLHSSYFR